MKILSVQANKFCNVQTLHSMVFQTLTLIRPNRPPFWKTHFTQNVTWVSGYIIDLLFILMPYVCFNTFFGILAHMGPKLGVPKLRKMQFLRNTKWPQVTL